MIEESPRLTPTSAEEHERVEGISAHDLRWLGEAPTGFRFNAGVVCGL